MNKLFAVTSISLSLCTVTPALADWQYTRWGMTPAQVQKAAKGAAKVTSELPEELVAGMSYRLVAPYTAGEFQFIAYFAFDAHDHLRLVLLDLVSGEPASLLMSLNRKYGEAKMPRPIDWQWRTARDAILFTPSKSGAHLTYNQLVGPSEKGL